ncbi:MAG: MarR family transcriptional regulator [Thermoproteota archaeon]|nr:MarR family transcriptional regulator [Thermoproteota archaeon]
MEKQEEIVHAVREKFTEMSTETMLFHQALADLLDFHITDHRCMHFLHSYGAMPAGRLAELTGLTTAAVTGIIDRLEDAGYVRRTNDPKDRRRTIVEPVQNKKLERKLEMIFTPFHEKMYKLFSSYSASELAFLLDVLTKSIELTREESKRLRMSLQRQSSRSVGARQ